MLSFYKRSWYNKLEKRASRLWEEGESRMAPKKILTFSYDDGVTQDLRLIEILNRYHLKGTFNLNSGCLGQKNHFMCRGAMVRHMRFTAGAAQRVYAGHEIAVHTLNHPNLTKMDDAEVIRQVREDQRALEAIAGYPITGMAYPEGGVNHDDRVVRLIRENTNLRYARTITSSYSFHPQQDLLRFAPTVYHIEWERMEELAEAFIHLKTDTPKLFYIWGHSYEFDIDDSWERFERLCARLAFRRDMQYLTNRQAFDYIYAQHGL